jgi:hypothetical protein
MFTATTWAQQFGAIEMPDDVSRTNCENSTHTQCGQHTCCGNPRFMGHEATCANVNKGSWVTRIWLNTIQFCICDEMPEYMRARGQMCVTCDEESFD